MWKAAGGKLHADCRRQVVTETVLALPQGRF
jgi:hypothetical protein